MGGLLSGLSKGLIGGMLKPTAGVFELASRSTQGEVGLRREMQGSEVSEGEDGEEGKEEEDIRHDKSDEIRADEQGGNESRAEESRGV
eukprot:768534-Hanusia_phi.AAC.3